MVVLLKYTIPRRGVLVFHNNKKNDSQETTTDDNSTKKTSLERPINLTPSYEAKKLIESQYILLFMGLYGANDKLNTSMATTWLKLPHDCRLIILNFCAKDLIPYRSKDDINSLHKLIIRTPNLNQFFARLTKAKSLTKITLDPKSESDPIRITGRFIIGAGITLL